ncbi:MAG: hypothetical protein HYT40_02455, partial [Candidatus Sungbacteria bacterium]|nr:hypothetical protein [Candidatus Sungbacteria bacterium]
VELIARMGLGDTKHNIIGQGEVDRWLLSSPRDRKEILEEALGLKVYQLKKTEAERKLDAAETNMTQVEALVREIAPHIKFLKNQAEKAEARGTLEAELEHLERVYFARVLSEIEKEESAIAKDAAPFEKELAAVEERVRTIEAQIAAREKAAVKDEDLAQLEREITGLEEKHRDIERGFGRAEGRAAAEREKIARPLMRITDATYVKEKIGALIRRIREVSQDPISTTALLGQLAEELEQLIADLERGQVEITPDAASKKELEAIEAEAREFEKKLQVLVADLKRSKDQLREKESLARTREADLRKLERELREAEEARAKLRSQLERATFEREKLALRRTDFDMELKIAGVTLLQVREVNAADVQESLPTQELFKKIERLRGKLEEIGGIDTSVVKEYQDTKSRHEFLTGELEDLKKASVSLKELIATLEEQIKNDFDQGFKKINEGFNHYFQLIFGGGKAKLMYQEIVERGSADEEGAEEAKREPEYGIDIDVNIPRKRIKSLSMLSGGERALTSIALLFAMVLVNPPPFLVLDETDAALDEANSQKYANTLADLSNKTQLIIITHNRETMLRAEVLYGVTMGDDGISKLLSIKFEEGEQYVNR